MEEHPVKGDCAACGDLLKYHDSWHLDENGDTLCWKCHLRQLLEKEFHDWLGAGEP